MAVVNETDCIAVKAAMDAFHRGVPKKMTMYELFADYRETTEVRVFNAAYLRGWTACAAWKDTEYDALALAADHGLSLVNRRTTLVCKQYAELLQSLVVPSIHETRAQMIRRHTAERQELQ